MTASRRCSSHANTTIYDCCKAICLILFTLGCCGLAEPQECFNYNRKTLCFMWLAACWYVSSLITCAYVKFQSTQVEDLDSLIRPIIYLELIMSVFMYLTTVISMYLKRNTNLKLYAMIQHLDEKLLKEFSCRLDYSKLMRKNFIILSVLAAVYMIVIIAAASHASNVQEFLVNLLAGLAYSAVTGGPHLTCFVQMNIAKILRMRFRLLQKLLTKQIVCSSKLSASQQVDCLRNLISFVQEYHNLIRHINEVYSICLTTTMLHDFTLTTSEFYLNLGSKKTPRENVLAWLVSVCMVLPLYEMTIAPVYCDKSKREGEKCFQIIKGADCWFPRDEHRVRQIVSACMLWRIDNKIEFLCGTINFNKQIIVVVYSQIFNYLFILIQFRMTQELGDEIEKQKTTLQEWIGVDYV